MQRLAPLFLIQSFSLNLFQTHHHKDHFFHFIEALICYLWYYPHILFQIFSRNERKKTITTIHFLIHFLLMTELFLVSLIDSKIGRKVWASLFQQAGVIDWILMNTFATILHWRPRDSMVLKQKLIQRLGKKSLNLICLKENAEIRNSYNVKKSLTF